MTSPYFAHFGLTDAPFTKEIADAELWLPSSKLAVVNTLIEALDERASVVLVGGLASARPACSAPCATAFPPPASA